MTEQELVVVTLNYRVRALDFLASSRDGLLKNYGLMDQRAAMEWVRGDVRVFGGIGTRLRCSAVWRRWRQLVCIWGLRRRGGFSRGR